MNMLGIFKIFKNAYLSMSLAKRLLLPIAILSVFGISALGFVLYNLEQRRFESSAKLQLQGFGEFLSSISVVAWTNWDIDSLNAFVEQGLKTPYVEYIVYTHKDKDLTSKSQRSEGLALERLFFEVADSNGRDTVKIEIGYDLTPGRTAIFRNALMSLLSYMAFFSIIFGVIFQTIRSLSQAVNEIKNKLVRVSNENLENAGHLTQSAEDLSSVASNQLSAVQESVSSLAEMRSMIELTLKNVTLAQEMGKEVVVTSTQGRQAMDVLDRQMGELQNSQQELTEMETIFSRIKEKTDIINSIVFKTQVLSFNAAIEAARAGQYGRGFSVVATEIGSLSHVSGAASKEIQGLLNDSQKAIRKLTSTVAEKIKSGESSSIAAFKSFNEINSQIQNISEAITDVSQACHEQFSGINQSTQAMENLHQTAEITRKSADDILDRSKSSLNLSEVVKESTTELQNVVSGVQSSESLELSDRAATNNSKKVA